MHKTEFFVLFLARWKRISYCSIVGFANKSLKVFWSVPAALAEETALILVLLVSEGFLFVCFSSWVFVWFLFNSTTAFFDEFPETQDKGIKYQLKQS